MEYYLVIQGYDLSSSIFRRTTPHELSLLLHGLIPAVLNGCRLISQFTYIDKEGLMAKCLYEILESNKQILALLSEQQQILTKGKSAAVSQANNNANDLVDEANSNLPIHLKLKNIKGRAAAAQSAIVQQQQQKNSSTIPQWVWSVGILFLLQYVLK
jgi:hypothetical protein